MVKQEGLLHVAESFADSVEWFEKTNGEVLHRQTRFIRANCASSLDRTGAFQALVAETVVRRFVDARDQHHKLWYDQAANLARAYAASRGQKVELARVGYLTRFEEWTDWATQVVRYVKSIVVEGDLDDAFSVASQEHPIPVVNYEGILLRIFLFLVILVRVFFVRIREGSTRARAEWNVGIRRVISHPHYQDIRDPDTVDYTAEALQRPPGTDE
jgi:hypothetical protein